MVTFTETALNAARRFQLEKPQRLQQGLRVWIADKNCDGFLYGVAFDDRLPDDVVLSFEGLTVLIDPGTARYIGESTVDFVDDERGRGFVVLNPKASDFRGKFFLRGEATEEQGA
jgi:iron-sulfur cluster assembly accessory protein